MYVGWDDEWVVGDVGMGVLWVCGMGILVVVCGGVGMWMGVLWMWVCVCCRGM